MRITLDIPNEHAHALLSLLANLTAKPEEPQADPAPGHPELPLTSLVRLESLHDGGVSNRHRQTIEEWANKNIRPDKIAAADPLKVAMDDPVEAEDPTRRELPWGDLPEPPPLPEGKTRWVNRGTFKATAIGLGIGTDGRIVYYPHSMTRGEWQRSCDFSGNMPHIEAI
jgi:hypothetical protein